MGKPGKSKKTPPYSEESVEDIEQDHEEQSESLV